MMMMEERVCGEPFFSHNAYVNVYLCSKLDQATDHETNKELISATATIVSKHPGLVVKRVERRGEVS